MLTVNDLMTTIPVVVSPTTRLNEAVALMQAEGCRHLPVVDDGKLIGILTDRDVRLARNSSLYETASCESCMTRDPITTTPDTPADQAAELLTLYKIGSLPVLDDGVLVGIVTVNDFLRRFNADDNPQDHFNSRPKAAFQWQYTGWDLVNG